MSHYDESERSRDPELKPMTNPPLPAGDETPLDQSDRELREILGHLCTFESDYPVTTQSVRNGVKRLQAQLTLARQQVTDITAERDHQHSRLCEVAAIMETRPGQTTTERATELRQQVTALQQERDIIAEISAERRSQDARWGGSTHDDQHTVNEWRQYIEYQAAYLTGTDVRGSRARLVKIAALAVAAIESADRHDGSGK